jgi:hypothetical protein
MPLKREVKYPIFLKCLRHATDEYWSNIFEELAYNNCISGTYISKGFYNSTIKGKEFTYNYLNKSDVELYHDIVKLLKDKLNIMSKNDKKLILDEISFLEKELQEYKTLGWGAIKKKGIKEILIQNYLIDMQKKYKLSDTQIKKLYNIINLGIMLKSIKASDIVYQDGEVRNIKGITFCIEKYIITVDIYTCPMDESKTSLSKKDKYLKEL